MTTSQNQALQLSDRTKHLKNILWVVLLLLVAAGIAFFIEHSRIQIQDSTEVTGRIVARHRKPHGNPPNGDYYEIVIEYQVNGQRKHLITSRAVWERWGTLNTIGSTVPVLLWGDGKACINQFNYLYPITVTLLGMAGIGVLSTLLVLFIPQKRYQAASERVRQYREAPKMPQRLSANRRLLLSRLHRLLFLFACFLGVNAIGWFRWSPWMVIASLVGLTLWFFLMRRMLVCPHCGASLIEDLQQIEPHFIKKRAANWLIVRDYLAKGVPVVCRSCGRSLDE